MKKFYIIGFILLLFFDTFGQTSFKLTAIAALPFEISFDWLVRIFTNGWAYVVMLGYTGAFMTWMVLLKKAPVGPAFAASHLQVVTVMLVSVVVFDEQITCIRLVGALFIIIGIVFLALAEQRLQRSS
ncbi:MULTISPECIES: EamA family transporter [unclassified Gilliamella]|uniref:EamA family transporter n=1 Tax=unclassified Gilliamella TaxID=2685620 RepID=UPI002269975F|nr:MULTISPECIES: EamA family transporter [unclassified Gilliamella]MCX8601253.1 EamA family transporter [Gilliamella sp. B3722]MCX8607407.1 EamA family transporter [Gilliamella sp. B3771]MCX8610404.1 EamA family transporter [Gilliamella sp. B3891]MCX8612927.1 EamA family transporter [Gilliamella sp. B3773]MCX8614836.1 EamA family transporter [Gilliamella sp. B3770]